MTRRKPFHLYSKAVHFQTGTPLHPREFESPSKEPTHVSKTQSEMRRKREKTYGAVRAITPVPSSQIREILFSAKFSRCTDKYSIPLFPSIFRPRSTLDNETENDHGPPVRSYEPESFPDTCYEPCPLL